MHKNKNVDFISLLPQSPNLVLGKHFIVHKQVAPYKLKRSIVDMPKLALMFIKYV